MTSDRKYNKSNSMVEILVDLFFYFSYHFIAIGYLSNVVDIDYVTFSDAAKSSATLLGE